MVDKVARVYEPITEHGKAKLIWSFNNNNIVNFELFIENNSD